MRDLLRNSRLWWFAVAVWFVVLFVLSSFVPPSPTTVVSFGDKIVHAFYFMSGGTCFFVALRLGIGRAWPWAAVAGATLVMASAVGAFDEWHQSFTPGRMGLDVWDWLADTVGGVLAWGGGAIALRRIGGAPRS